MVESRTWQPFLFQELLSKESGAPCISRTREPISLKFFIVGIVSSRATSISRKTGSRICLKPVFRGKRLVLYLESPITRENLDGFKSIYLYESSLRGLHSANHKIYPLRTSFYTWIYTTISLDTNKLVPEIFLLFGNGFKLTPKSPPLQYASNSSHVKQDYHKKRSEMCPTLV